MMIQHCHPALHPNFTKLVGGGEYAKDFIESLPSILVSASQIEEVHLRYNPGYYDDGDIDWVEHYWCLSHFKAVAYRLSHYVSEQPLDVDSKHGLRTETMYRFYFHNDEDAMVMRMQT